jgi:hypothetical protein
MRRCSRTTAALPLHHRDQVDRLFMTQALCRRCESVEHDQSPRASDRVPVLARFASDVIQNPGEVETPDAGFRDRDRASLR